MADANDVAAALLRETGAVTTMKLQKLVYYSQAWHLAFNSEPLFQDTIEAWEQRPITPVLYRKHKGQHKVSSWPFGNSDNLSKSERGTVSWVLAKYSHFSAESLSRMAHMETPWIIARGFSGNNDKSSDPIDLNIMSHFYARQIADVGVAVAQAAASASMEGVDLDDQWQEELRSVASGAKSASEAIADEIRRATRR